VSETLDHTIPYPLNHASTRTIGLQLKNKHGKSSVSVQCAITGLCLRMRHRPSA